MAVQNQQQTNNKFHPLLRGLNISCGEKRKLDGKSKSDKAISASEILTFLLKNGSLSEETLTSAAKTIRQTQKENGADATIANNDGRDNSTGALKQSKAATTSNQNSNGQARTRHIALRFFYNGASYSGLAQNIGQENDNSVERQLFNALLKARLISSRGTSNYSRCGRTDRGVSAAGQVVALHLKSSFPANASFDEHGTSLLADGDLPKNEHESLKIWTIARSKSQKRNKKGKNGTACDPEILAPANRIERELTEYSYAKILNNILPPSIRILGWTPVTEDFSARFSAGSRTYRYFFCKRRMNIDAIQDGLKLLVGKHDFRNFCKMDVEKVYNFERLIHSADLIQVQASGQSTSSGEKDIYYLRIVGQAFLWHQIRCIAEVIFMIGNGFESPSIITELLNVEKHPGKPGYPLADEKPLVLHDCAFPNLQFGHSVQNLWTVSCQLETQWEELALAAARIRSVIGSLRSCSILKDDLIAFADSKLTDRSKKLQRRGVYEVRDDSSQGVADDSVALSDIVSWADGLQWLERRNLVPSPTGVTNTIHVPLMTRSMGPSYEEKVENLKKSEKRRMKFEENIIKKRKTPEEDKAFYDHKINQGGTGI